MAKHYKAAFEKISEEKQARILDAGTAEFAAKGFPGANINRIAKEAGISIGAMYNYFGSKDDLFLTIIDQAHAILETVIDDVARADADIFESIEKLLRAAQTYSKQYPELTQIYLDMTSEGLSHLSRQLSGQMETISSKFYKTLIARAAAEGRVASGIDSQVASFCLDNLIMMLQYSYASDYFKERMKIFIGPDAALDDERVIREMMRFIRGAFSGGESEKKTSA
jgi:AcrR family transcriptional regulator